jgi:hypothetical protein
MGLSNYGVKFLREWVHTKGIVKRIVDQVVENSAPPYALGIPMNYTKSDLDSLNELNEEISEIRNLLKITIEKYKEQIL